MEGRGVHLQSQFPGRGWPAPHAGGTHIRPPRPEFFTQNFTLRHAVTPESLPYHYRIALLRHAVASSREVAYHVLPLEQAAD